MDETCETSTYIARLSGRHVASERMLCIPVKRVFDSFVFLSHTARTKYPETVLLENLSPIKDRIRKMPSGHFAVAESLFETNGLRYRRLW